MNAYDYDSQKWIDGEKGKALRLEQLREELNILERARKAKLARVMNLDGENSIKIIESTKKIIKNTIKQIENVILTK